MRRWYCSIGAVDAAGLASMLRRLLVLEDAFNPNENVVIAAIATICFAEIIRVVSPRGRNAVNPHLRMSFAILDSLPLVYRRHRVWALLRLCHLIVAIVPCRIMDGERLCHS